MKIQSATGPLRARLYIIIFESDRAGGKLFDVALIGAIVLSVLAVMLESVASIRIRHGQSLQLIEWFFTLLFTVEYFLRIFSVRKPHTYIFSFFGIIDFLAIIPTYLSVLIPGTQFLLVIRILRILRVFRVLKLARFLSQANMLMTALRASRHKIFVFVFTVFTLVIIIGSLMYVIEGEQHGFTSIPRSIYWAIVTLTTVGYGDISPQTNAGQALAALVMILGYGIIAVPTGIVTAEFTAAHRKAAAEKICNQCGLTNHDEDALYCKHCGSALSISRNLNG